MNQVKKNNTNVSKVNNNKNNNNNKILKSLIDIISQNT